MSARTPFDGVRIAGVHTTRQARSLRPLTSFALAFEALSGALADAGLEVGDLDGICSAIPDWPYGTGSSRLRPEHFWARQLGRPLRWMGAEHGVAGVLDAAAAIAAGLASTVAVVGAQVQPGPDQATASWTRPADEFSAWTGSYTAVQYGLVAQRYLHEHGPTALPAMAEVAATIRNFAHVNPDAVYFGRGPYTARDVLESRPIASPLTLLMCCAVNDGASAVVLTTAGRSRGRRPVRILAGGSRQPYPPYHEPPLLRRDADEGRFAEEIFSTAGLRPEDVDVLELYDHFAIGVLMELELYSICDPGGAAELALSGELGLRGRFPTCTDGGCLGFSHNGRPPTLRVVEAVRQLRGEVKDLCEGWERGLHSHEPGRCRAVEDVRIALASGPGPPTGGGAFALLALD